MDMREDVARAISEAHRLHGRSFYAMADAAIAAMGGGVKVKPLVWTQQDETENECWTADAFGLTYEANVDVDGQAYWGFFRSLFSPDTLVDGGLAEAKAAAQADYECRILSVLINPGEHHDQD